MNDPSRSRTAKAMAARLKAQKQLIAEMNQSRKSLLTMKAIGRLVNRIDLDGEPIVEMADTILSAINNMEKSIKKIESKE